MKAAGASVKSGTQLTFLHGILWLAMTMILGGAGIIVSDILLLGGVILLAGLALGAACGAWYELYRIRRRLAEERSMIELPTATLLGMGGCAIVAAMPATALWYFLAHVLDDAAPAWLAALGVVALYALAYLGLAKHFGVSELASWLAGLTGRSKRGGD